MREISFDWDQWNVQKNEAKHGVSRIEAESAFFDRNYKLFRGEKHPTETERRFILLGKGSEGRVFMVGFTLRGQMVRVITARSASRKERDIYEKQ